MEEIIVTYTITKKELKAYIKNSSSKIFNFHLYIVAFTCVAVASLIFLVNKPSPYTAGVLTMSVILALLIALAFYILPLSSFKEENAKKGTYTFSDTGVKIETDVSSVSLSWELYKAVYVSSDMFVFRMKNSTTWFLPYHVFGDNIIAFKKLLKSQRDKGLIRILDNN